MLLRLISQRSEGADISQPGQRTCQDTRRSASCASISAISVPTDRACSPAARRSSRTDNPGVARLVWRSATTQRRSPLRLGFEHQLAWPVCHIAIREPHAICRRLPHMPTWAQAQSQLMVARSCLSRYVWMTFSALASLSNGGHVASRFRAMPAIRSNRADGRTRNICR